MPRSLVIPLMIASAACDQAEPAVTQSTAGFLCEDGKYFRVEFSALEARVTTPVGTEVLTRDLTSEEQRFASDRVVLAVDEAGAELRGLPEGEFRQCRRMRPGGAQTG